MSYVKFYYNILNNYPVKVSLPSESEIPYNSLQKRKWLADKKQLKHDRRT